MKRPCVKSHGIYTKLVDKVKINDRMREYMKQDASSAIGRSGREAGRAATGGALAATFCMRCMMRMRLSMQA